MKTDLEAAGMAADANLGVADAMSWPIGVLTALLALSYSWSWLGAVAAALAAHVLSINLSTRRYDRWLRAQGSEYFDSLP